MSDSNKGNLEDSAIGSAATGLVSLGIGTVLASYTAVETPTWLFAFLLGYLLYFLAIKAACARQPKVAAFVYGPPFVISLVANAITRFISTPSVGSALIGCAAASLVVTAYGMTGVIAKRNDLTLFHFFIAAVPLFMVNWRLYS